MGRWRKRTTASWRSNRPAWLHELGICPTCRRTTESGTQATAKDRTVKEATAAANDGLPSTAGVVGKPNARVPVIKVTLQRFGGPRLPLVSEAEVHRETVRDSGLVLNKQSVIRVGQHGFRLISHCFGAGAAEIQRSVDRRLRE